MSARSLERNLGKWLASRMKSNAFVIWFCRYVGYAYGTRTTNNQHAKNLAKADNQNGIIHWKRLFRSYLLYSNNGNVVFSLIDGIAMTANTIVIQSQPIRTDWINKIERGKENGMVTCTIWLSIGPVGVYAFKGSDAETALQLLANHSALQA